MLDISKKIPKGYFQTEFDLVNATNFPVSFNLFDVNTLNVVETQAQPIVAPNLVGADISLGGSPLFLAYCPINNSVYVSHIGHSFISVIDCSTNLLVTNIMTTATSSQIAYNTSTNTMYVVELASSSVFIIDCNTNTIIGSPIVVGSSPYGIVYNPSDNRMYVSNQLGLSISIIDCNTNSVIFTIPTGIVQPFDLAYNPVNNSVYFLDNNITNILSVLDCNTNLITTTIIPSGVNQFQIEYCSSNNTMYITNQNTNDVSVIDCNTNTIIGSPISVGTNPYQVSYNSLLNLMYVSNANSSNISVIDCSSNLVVQTILLSGNPFGIVYNISSNSFYTSILLSGVVVPVSPSTFTTTYIGGTFNYNQFIQDIQDNPVSVKDVMFYSSDPENINQVFFTLFKDADGKSDYKPRYPQLSIGVNQFQGSVSKVDFGEKGVLLDSNNSFYDVTVQPNSTLKLVLIMKQMKKSYSLDAPDISENMDLIKNNVQYILGVDGRNNIERFSVFNLGENNK